MNSNNTNTKGMNMNANISRHILSLVASGLSLREAFDAVLGAGAFEKLAGEVYDALRK